MNQRKKIITVDAHQHFWDFERFAYPWMTAEMEVLQRNYLPSDLRPKLDRAGIDRTVFVQSQHSLDEVRWALQLAADNPWIAGVAGWLDLKSPQLEQQIDSFAVHPKFVGVRHIVHDELDDRWLLRDDVVTGLKLLARRELAYDLLLRPQHLPIIPELAKRVPELRMVIDHLAKPLIRQGKIEPWRTDMAQVARLPNLYCKISGMITEADHQHWKASDLVPYIDCVLELFGPQRLMFGSDWPMCRLAGEYCEVVAATQQALNQLSPDERTAIFGGTAVHFYRLPTDS